MMIWDDVEMKREVREDTLWEMVQRLDRAMRQPIHDYPTRELKPELREDDRR